MVVVFEVAECNTPSLYLLRHYTTGVAVAADIAEDIDTELFELQEPDVVVVAWAMLVHAVILTLQPGIEAR